MAFFRSNILKQHMQVEHLQTYNGLAQARIRAAEKDKECSICNKSFSSKHKRILHQQKQHGLASTSNATVRAHSHKESVGKVTAVTESVITNFSINTKSTVESPLGRAEIVTQHFPTATVTTVTQTEAKGRPPNATPPLTIVSSVPDNFFAEDDILPDDIVSRDPDDSFAEDSDPNDISRLLPDSWLN